MDTTWKYLQVRFEPGLYRKLQMLSVDRDQSVSELVRGWVVQAIGEGDREVHPLVRKVAKVESQSLEPPVSIISSQSTFKEELKEGYGWCRVCNVEQVKLPGFMCPKCKKL